MSYALEFNERALQGLRTMDPWLQEETLDELEELAAHPPSPRRRHLGSAVHDFVRHQGSSAFYVFVTFTPDPTSAVVRVNDIGLHIRSGG